MTSYPGALFTWTNRVDAVDDVLAADPNSLAAETIAIETDLVGASGTASGLKQAAASFFANWTAEHNTNGTHKAITTPKVTITQAVATSGSPNALIVTGAAHTTLAASSEAIDINLNLARTVQFAAGALSLQRAINIAAPTYAFSSASTLTDAATVYIDRAPQAGPNATITRAHSLWVAAGNVRFDGSLAIGVNAPDAALHVVGVNVSGTGQLKVQGSGTDEPRSSWYKADGTKRGTIGHDGTAFFINDVIYCSANSGGIVGIGTSVFTGASAGDHVLAYAKDNRSVNNAGNNTYSLIRGGTVGGQADAVVIASGGSPLAFGNSNRTAATVAANFTADYYILFLDASGNPFYVPGRNTTW